MRFVRKREVKMQPIVLQIVVQLRGQVEEDLHHVRDVKSFWVQE
jgi:hypothetical protein